MELAFNKYKLIRDLAVLSVIGILIGHLISIPIIVWRSLFVLLNIVAIFLNVNHLCNAEKYVVALIVYCSICTFVDYNPQYNTSIGAILFTVPALILFHFLDSKGVITQKWINVCCVLFIIAAVIYYRYKTSQMLSEYEWAEEYGFTNNASTIFVGLLLFLLLCDVKIITWVGFAVCWYFLILSAKRGNIVESAIPTLLLVSQSVKNNDRRSWWHFLITITSLVVIAMGIRIGITLFNENEFLINKMERSDSGRLEIWAGLLHEWATSDRFINNIVGFGVSGTRDLWGMSAHNDWLEILIDFGIIGFFLQICIFLYMIKLGSKKTANRSLLIGCILVWFIKTMISMGFKDPLNIFIFITLGIVISRTLKFSKTVNDSTI